MAQTRNKFPHQNAKPLPSLVGSYPLTCQLAFLLPSSLMPNRKQTIGFVFLSFFLLLSLFWLFPPFHYAPDLDFDASFPHHPHAPGPHRPIQRPQRPNPTTQDAFIWRHRQNLVRDAFLHALNGYKEYAFPNDELLSISGGSSNKYVTCYLCCYDQLSRLFGRRFNGWSVTLLDSMDTMWIMGLHDEFDNALRVVAAQNFTSSSVCVFFRPPFNPSPFPYPFPQQTRTPLPRFLRPQSGT